MDTRDGLLLEMCASLLSNNILIYTEHHSYAPLHSSLSAISAYLQRYFLVIVNVQGEKLFLK